MLLTALVYRFTPVRAFAFDRLGRAHVAIPSHAKGTAASSTMGLVDGTSRSRRASKLADVHALLVIQLRSSGAPWRFGDGARLDFGVEDRIIATGRLLNRDALLILGDVILRTAGHGHRDATRGGGIERGSLGASWRLVVDANTPLKLGSILTFRAFDRGTAGASEMLAIGTHGRLQRHTDVSLLQISRAT